MKLLLHTCCGPCFLGVWEELGTHEDFETTLYYFNPNIYPVDEWRRRRDSLRLAVERKAVPLIGTEYQGEKYFEAINSHVIPVIDSEVSLIAQTRRAKAGIQENEKGMDPWFAARDDKEGLVAPEFRCPVCYRLRLTETAKYAKANGYDAFSTTLLVSPYQQHEELKRIGEEVGAEVGIDFYYTDWRPYFREGQNEAKKMEIYRQRYCGCKYSLKENSIR